jgi:hypothetical protein
MHRYSAVFTTGRGGAGAVRVEWDCTAFLDAQTDTEDVVTAEYRDRLDARLDENPSAPDWDGLLRHDPAAPALVREWAGDFAIDLHRDDDDGVDDE